MADICERCRREIAKLLDEYAGRISERDYPDAVTALLRFRSEVLQPPDEDCRPND